ncbi:MAG TPA: M20/M25/M40 family metallo-hydrolase [Acidobacteriota bacterium]|nr:M20/M25/M40 family metallo-hydrolase [Acidobacteriota bacterium]
MKTTGMRMLAVLGLWVAVAAGQEESSAVGPDAGLTAEYRETADRIIEAALADDEGWAKLSHLTDRIGHRLSGSKALQEAVLWSFEQMQKDGLSNVRMQPVAVPHWVRGREWVKVTSPVERELAMLGLGGSVGTPPEGIEAEVVSASSFDELEALGREQVEGKIVLWNVEWDGYRRTVAYRTRGATAAARLGALASLVRSVGPVSLQTPHTGAMRYGDDADKIPSAAVTIEGAELIQRLIESGQTVRVRLYMEARTLPDALSANVMGEIPGREMPEEVVVLGGHIDSWDVGQGAQDDGSGCIASLQAVALLKKLGLEARRTIRVVFWTNEENGLAGGRAYRSALGEDVHSHAAAIEMDGGSEHPAGFGLASLAVAGVAQGGERVEAKLRQIGALLDPIEAGRITWGGGGADISPLIREGVPGFGLRTRGEKYFHWHHTEADTLDKINPDHFRKNVAALAILSYVLADMPQRLPDFLQAED